ncbi:uncharacterized protein C16orf46 homolog [Heteronotia binoei]|uniref:uncharacterized protein C16orf46 homolog n=1 Tax=Heteronotia binoei TaxID=13085 RepID=UPI00292F2AD6|nr:uncharacterized protein C16orf46 homolog [Heteronotia binoei]
MHAFQGRSPLSGQVEDAHGAAQGRGFGPHRLQADLVLADALQEAGSGAGLRREEGLQQGRGGPEEHRLQLAEGGRLARLEQAERVEPAESATVMTSSGQNQSEISSEKATANVKTVERDWRCIYPNERRERNQIYTLLSISNSANEQEEKSLECINGTGWEEAVQGWSKTASFAHLQLQKRARKTRTSESVGGCLYCLDLMHIIDKGLEQDPKLSASVATDSIPEKQTLLYSNTALSSYSVVDDSKKDNYNGKLNSTQTSQGEKKRLSLKEAQALLSEKKTFLMKENQLFQAEKKAVPIREYSILALGKPKSVETLKCKDTKNHEPVTGNLGYSEATPVKSSMVLPPLKDTAFKNSLDPSPKKSKPIIFQANEKASRAVSETVSCPQVFKAKEPNHEKGVDLTGDALKEPVKLYERTTFAPKFPKTSCISGTTDQCYWRCAFIRDRKITPVSNSIALRRKNHHSGMHFLHTKGARDSKADENWDPCTRSRNHTGPRQGNESKTQEIPLLSGLFPSLTELGWGRATPFACCKIQLKSKNPRISKTVSNISHRNKAPEGNLAWITQPERNRTNTYHKFTEGETVSSYKKLKASYFKPYNYIPVMTVHPEGERMNGKLDSIRAFLSEKRTLPIKEYEIKYSEGYAKPAVLKYPKIHLPRIIQSNTPIDFSYPSLNAFLVLKPEGKGIVSLHLEPPSKKNETSTVKKTKGGSTSTETLLHSRQIKKGKQKSKRNIVMRNKIATKQIKNNVPPFHVSLML